MRGATQTAAAAAALIAAVPCLLLRLRTRHSQCSCPAPSQYCCADGLGCEWDAKSACVGNRDPDVPLCGACRVGYTFSITGNGCVANDTCADHQKVAAFGFSQFAYWLFFSSLFLHQSRFQPLLKTMPRWLVTKPAPRSESYKGDNGSVSVTIYYFQLAALAVPQGRAKLATSMAALVCYFGKVFSKKSMPSWAECSGEVQVPQRVAKAPLRLPCWPDRWQRHWGCSF